MGSIASAGVDKKVIRILANIYSNAIAYVRLDQNGKNLNEKKWLNREILSRSL